MQEEILNEKQVNQQERRPNEKQEEKLSIGSILKTIYTSSSSSGLAGRSR